MAFAVFGHWLLCYMKLWSLTLIISDSIGFWPFIVFCTGKKGKLVAVLVNNLLGTGLVTLKYW
jgi:hypothetical protein